jgi:hypothetical protein
MLKLYSTHTIAGLTVYEDDTDPAKFYVMPNQPQFRVDPQTNKPVFKFIKYLMPVNRPDGSIGGGFLIFDSSFVIPDASRAKVQSELNALLKSRGLKDATGAALTAQTTVPTFTKGTASLTLLDTSGALVTKIESAGKPSLIGSLVCSFTAELSPEGSAVVEGAMQGAGGVVQIAYDLHYTAILPPIKGHVWFHATQAQKFYQNITKSNPNFWGNDTTENETLRQKFTDDQAGGVDFDFSGLDPNDPNSAKVKDDILNWGWSQLANAAKMVVPGAPGTQQTLNDSGQSSSGSGSGSGSGSDSSGTGSDSSGTGSDSSGSSQSGGLGQDRSDDGMESVTRDEKSVSKFDFNQYYHEKDAVDYETTQQGTLPNIPNFKDYCSTINANDPFFAQIHATVSVNADFTMLGINSVDVNLQYTKSKPPTVAALHFTKPDDVGKFDSDTVNGDMHYSYNFTVNYQGQSKPYVSPVVTWQTPHITVDVGTLGIFFVAVVIGSVDFTKTPQVQVAIQYPDTDANGAPISRQLSFDSTKKTDSVSVVLLKPVTKPFTYQVTYIMTDGTQVVTPWASSSMNQIFVNTPFTTKTVSFVSEGDFVNNIDNIFLKMTYNDGLNNYQQSTDYTFTSANRSHDWTFPVLGSGQGSVTYSGVVSYKDHTTENIPSTTAASSLVTFGPPNQQVITVTPDPAMIDFTQVKLIQLNFEYIDPANSIDIKQEIVLKANSATPPNWTFYTKDPTKTAYTYQATFYMATTPPTVVKGNPTPASDTDLVLMMPS